MPLLDVKPVKVFSRENPCTKVDLYNAFRRGGKYVPRPFVEVRGEIGLNAPKYLRREGYVTMDTLNGIDYLQLTMAGESWLTAGLARHLELHPEDAAKLTQPLPGASKAKATAGAAKRLTRSRG